MIKSANGLFIYELQPILDEEGFRSLGSVRPLPGPGPASPLKRILPERIANRSWTVPRLAGTWVPFTVVAGGKKISDYPCIDLTVPAFSEAAVSTLHEFLVSNGEILPIFSNDGNFSLYNTITILDAIDLERSKIVWTSEGLIAFRIDECVLHADVLTGNDIFRLRECPANVYVSERFKSAVERSGLRGMKFSKLNSK